MSKPVIAVVVPSYKVTSHIVQTLSEIGKEVSYIFVVDDACPDGSGKLSTGKSLRLTCESHLPRGEPRSRWGHDHWL
jgi:hypothetical protein